jgi:bacteriophage CI repressor
MDLNSRVQKIINYSELSSSEFADEIGVQRSNISHVLSGRNKPSLDFLMKIKDRFPEIQWEWLIEGKGAMIFSEDETASTPSSYSLEESKINDDEPIITGLFSIPSQEIDENTKQEEEKSEISEPIQYNNIVENTPEISENKNISEAETPSEKGNSIKKIVFFYENGKFEVFEP